MTKVINLRRKYKRNFDTPKTKLKKINIINTDFFKFIYLIISIVALLIGCLIFKDTPIDYLNEICSNLLNQFQYGTYSKILISLLKYEIILYFFMFFIGTSYIGIPLTILPLTLKCLLIGYFSSYMYFEYNMKGILFSLILLFPMYVITTASYIYSANESFYMSRYILRTLTNKNTADNISIKLYLIRFIILFTLSLATISVNAFLITILANRFNLH